LDSSQFNRIVHVGEAILERRPADSLASMYLHLAYYNHAVSLLKVVDESLVNREFMDRQKEAMAYLEKSKEYYLLFKKAPR
jgi:hypothetical protein